MACNDRQLTQAQREAAFAQQRTGVVRAVRPFSGSATVENLVDYINRELGPAVRASRDAINECFLQVADNAPSANPLAFYFATDTTNADPTVGRIRLNQAIQNTATVMRVSQSNARLVDVQPWLDVMAGGPTTPLGVVTLVDAINPARFIRWDLNTMTDQGAYWDLGITVIESSDASPFVEDEAVVVGFISGVSAAGSTIPVGALTPIARDTFVGNIGTTTAAPVAVPLASIDSTSIVYDTTVHEMQRAALTGFAASTQNSNATTSAEPIVTYSASANMSAERVLTSSTSNTISTVVANQIAVESTAVTGAIAIAANATASVFAGIRDNGSAETDRTNLNFVSGDSNTAVVTDDAGNDELEVTFNYVGSTTNVNLTGLTGDQNVVDISTLRCGGSVTVESVSADYTIDGFTAKTDGFWFWFIDRRTTGTAAGQFLEDSGSTTTSIRNENEIETDINVAGRALLYYTNSRWRVAASSQPGQLIAYTEYTSGSGTHTYSRRTRLVEAELVQCGAGGGGVASCSATEAGAGGGGSGGETSRQSIPVPAASSAYVVGIGGVGGVGGSAPTSGGASTSLAGFATPNGGTAGVSDPGSVPEHLTPGGSGQGNNCSSGLPGWCNGGGVAAIGHGGEGGAGVNGGGGKGEVRSSAGTTVGRNGESPGAGGGGAINVNIGSAVNGGDGADGRIRIWEYT